jgi:hypothetical protein
MKKLKAFSFLLLFVFLANNIFADTNSTSIGGEKSIFAYIIPNSGSAYYLGGSMWDIGKYYNSSMGLTYINRALFDISLSTIPSNATITGVTLNYSAISSDASTTHKCKITACTAASNYEGYWKNIGSSTVLFTDVNYGSGTKNSTDLTQLISANKGGALKIGMLALDETSYDCAATVSLSLDITYTTPSVNITFTATNNFTTSFGNGSIIIDGTTWGAPKSIAKTAGQSASLTAVSPQTDAQNYQRVWNSGNSNWSAVNATYVPIPLSNNTKSNLQYYFFSKRRQRRHIHR